MKYSFKHRQAVKLISQNYPEYDTTLDRNFLYDFLRNRGYIWDVEKQEFVKVDRQNNLNGKGKKTGGKATYHLTVRVEPKLYDDIKSHCQKREISSNSFINSLLEAYFEGELIHEDQLILTNSHHQVNGSVPQWVSGTVLTNIEKQNNDIKRDTESILEVLKSLL